VRGYILAPQSNPDLQGSCSSASHCSLSDSSEQIPPNFDTLFGTSLEGLQLIKGVTARRVSKSFGVKGLMDLLSDVFLLETSTFSYT
jgi:hypothetical protein